jgi:hypothetical protein
MIGEKIWRVKLQQKNQFGKPSQQKKNKDQIWEIKKIKGEWIWKQFPILNN